MVKHENMIFEDFWPLLWVPITLQANISKTA